MIIYFPLVVTKDIPSLDNLVRNRVRLAIENKLSVNPVYYGAPLNGTLKKLWKLRVGDWRVVYTIEKSDVRIWAIAHRKEVYKIMLGRIK